MVKSLSAFPEPGMGDTDSVKISAGKKTRYGATPQDAGLEEATADNSMLSSTGVPPICMCILAVELCERLAFYTFTGTQEFYLERNGYTLAQAGGLNASMSTLCMAWALAAGWVADTVLGRYKTIVVFGCLYVIGSLVATVAAFPSINNTKLYLFGIMMLIPMGTAGIKANISNFGADQYDVSIPSQRKAQETFFSWFYLSINLGSAVAYGYLTTMGSNGGLGVSKQYGYFAVYAIAAFCMAFAVCVFISGRSHYRMQPVQSQSPLGGVVKHVTRASSLGSKKATSMCIASILLMFAIVFSVTATILPEAAAARPMNIAAFFCATFGTIGVVIPCLDPSWVVADAVEGELLQPHDTQAFLRVMPVLVLGNLAFCPLYNCMQYWYQQQACQMDLRVPMSGGAHQFAGSFFMIADCLGIVIATPLAIDYVNPAMERYFAGRFNHGAKFGVGMGFAALSVLVAASMEVLRRASAVMLGAGQSNCAPAGVQMSEMSATWMFLPFLLMGIGEIYTQPVLMHFAYTNSPQPLRTLAAVTALVIGAISNAIFTVQIAALSPYVKDDLNKGHLEYGYYMNAALGLTLYMFFLACLGRYEQRGNR